MHNNAPPTLSALRVDDLNERTQSGIAKMIDLATGVKLHALEFIPTAQSGRDILMVHGLASNAQLWVMSARLLAAKGHRVLAIDQRGHGLSEKHGDTFEMDMFVADLVDFIGQLQLTKPLLVGQSWGGNVTVETAFRRPDLVSGVVAVDGGTICLRDVFPDWDSCVQQLHPPKLEGTRAEVLRGAIRNMRSHWSDEAIKATMANMEILEDGTIRPRLSHPRHIEILRSLWEHEPIAAIQNSGVPTLLLPALPSDSGDDPWIRQKADVLKHLQDLDHVRVRVFLDADHDIHAEQPEELADTIDSAISEGFFTR